jgi:hypothetical protein
MCDSQEIQSSTQPPSADRRVNLAKTNGAPTGLATKKVPYFYAIGTADPGTGSKDGYFFTMPELQEVVLSACMQGIRDVVYTWLDKKKGLMVILRFDSTTLRSKVILEWIKNGLFSGISLGYNADVKYVDGLIVVHKKTIVELSIVRDPFHKSCKIGFIGNTLPVPSSKTQTVANDVSADIAARLKDLPPLHAENDDDPWQLVFAGC